MTAAERIASLTDEGTFDEYAEDLVSTDPLEFDDQIGRASCRERV
jgi:acetyl-CoA carboxylase beta subunit